MSVVLPINPNTALARVAASLPSVKPAMPVAEFGHKEPMSGWLRVLVTVERTRSRWAVVQTAYTTRDQQWGGTRIPAGSLHTRVVVATLLTKSAAIAKAKRGAA